MKKSIQEVYYDDVIAKKIFINSKIVYKFANIFKFEKDIKGKLVFFSKQENRFFLQKKINKYYVTNQIITIDKYYDKR